MDINQLASSWKTAPVIVQAYRFVFFFRTEASVATFAAVVRSGGYTNHGVVFMTNYH